MTETPPILFLIFNRPDLTARVFERIREARPSKLFVAADGPRPDRNGEAEVCAAVRRVVDEGVDWDCEVQTLYRENNLGCRDAVSSAISWFFEHVEEGIILEDDCLPDLSFFPFCRELLERYREDDRISIVCGENPSVGSVTSPFSYGYSIYPLIWGWATWKRSWAMYNPDSIIGSASRRGWLERLFGSASAADYWVNQFTAVERGEIDTWDMRFIINCWLSNTVAISPAVNLVTNFGFDERSTHCKISWEGASNPAEEIRFPLVHPVTVCRDFGLDEKLSARRFGIEIQSGHFQGWGRRLDKFAGRAIQQAERLRPSRVIGKFWRIYERLAGNAIKERVE